MGVEMCVCRRKGEERRPHLGTREQKAAVFPTGGGITEEGGMRWGFKEGRPTQARLWDNLTPLRTPQGPSWAARISCMDSQHQPAPGSDSGYLEGPESQGPSPGVSLVLILGDSFRG